MRLKNGRRRNMKTAYLHCILLDGSETMTAQPDMTVIVEDGKITAIEKNLPAPIAAKS